MSSAIKSAPNNLTQICNSAFRSLKKAGPAVAFTGIIAAVGFLPEDAETSGNNSQAKTLRYLERSPGCDAQDIENFKNRGIPCDASSHPAVE